MPVSKGKSSKGPLSFLGGIIGKIKGKPKASSAKKLPARKVSAPKRKLKSSAPVRNATKKTASKKKAVVGKNVAPKRRKAAGR